MEYVEMIGVVTVTVGNIVAIRLGDTENSRKQAFDTLALPLVEKGHVAGFDSSEHTLVIPRTPFKPNTREHWPDKGLHVTVVMEGRDLGGSIDKVSNDAVCLDGERIVVRFDPLSVKMLEGVPDNDESTGCVYYLALDISDYTINLMNELRARLSLPPIGTTLPHVSIAGIAPKDGDMVRFRREWCPPRPTSGLPTPITEFKRQASSLYI